MKKIILFLVLFLAAIVSVSAQSNCQDAYNGYTTTKSILSDLNGINSKLSNCPVMLVGPVASLVGDGNMRLIIMMKSGVAEPIYGTIKNGNLVSVSKTASTHKYIITTDEGSLNMLLQSKNKVGASFFLYLNKKIKIAASGFISNVKLFFARPFLSYAAKKGQVEPEPEKPAEGPRGKPDYCDGTYPPGHREYAANKALWDSYSADTDAVCQSQYGRGTPSPCVHTVQLSVDGNPYYLCWYNE